MSKCTISLLGILYIYNLLFAKKANYVFFSFLSQKRPLRARNRVLAVISLRQRRSNRGSPPPSSFAEGSQSPPPSLLPPPPPFLLSLSFLPPPSLSVFCSIQKRESFASTFFFRRRHSSRGSRPFRIHPTEESPEKHQVLLFFVWRVRLDNCKAPNTAPAKGNVGRLVRLVSVLQQ